MGSKFTVPSDGRDELNFDSTLYYAPGHNEVSETWMYRAKKS
jgi:hypothetical protein